MENLEMTEPPGYETFWNQRRVLITGHTGFKGSWLSLWLSKLGANITGISLCPDCEPNLFTVANVSASCENYFVDIRDDELLANHVNKANPEIVFHLAAQSLVRRGYRQPSETFQTNVMGTINLLQALREISETKVVIVVTSDKVYCNNEWYWPYREIDTLGGHDPYSASKAACEIATNSFRESYFEDIGIALATVRAGNVIGGGDWADDRLIPDAVRAWQAGQVLRIRRPNTIRPWQYVLDPLAGYLKLAKKLYFEPQLRGAFNFGPLSSELIRVREVIDKARVVYGEGEIHYCEELSGPHEAATLMVDISKSRQLLGHKPRYSFSDALRKTMLWYKKQFEGVDARFLCNKDIEDYENTL